MCTPLVLEERVAILNMLIGVCVYVILLPRPSDDGMGYCPYCEGWGRVFSAYICRYQCAGILGMMEVILC